METQKLTIKDFFAKENVKAKFHELMGQRANAFVTSILSLAHNSAYLSKCSPESIYTSAMIAATLDLPINQNLGFAYIIPYGESAQFQIGYKGLIQLALRSGQFKTIASCPVFEGQLIEENPLTGVKFDWTKKTSDKVIGYAAYFSLLNGFEKTDFKTVEEIKKHGQRFSKTFSSRGGIWEKDFDAMAQKTVLKLLISKYAPMSIEMQRAVIADQAVIKDAETMDVDYVDEGLDKEIVDVADLLELFEIKKDVLSEDEKSFALRIINGKEEKSFKKLFEVLKSK